MRVVAFVPAKGSSDRVQNKNMRLLNGEPLFVYTLRKLLKCELIDDVYLDSEDPKILEIGKEIGVKLLPRDPSLATNATDGNSLFWNQVKQVEADIYIQHLCTSPFIKEETIHHAIQILKSDKHIDSVVLGKKEKVYRWENEKPIYDIDNIPNSKDLPDSITESMSLYVVKKEAVEQTHRRIGNYPKMIFATPIEHIDINYEEDLILAETIAAGILMSEEKKLRVLGRFLSSPILSDICDKYNLSTVLNPEYQSNLPNTKLFGRARTLHIRAATENDSADSIYDALKSYNHIVSNNIIIVKNDLPKFAYFGELNMALSVRSGASGAIIAGVTRDTSATAEAGFPVFAKGRYCKDIKGRGAVETINSPIEIDGVHIHPNELIFADQDGIVIIPREYEVNILKEAIDILVSEKKIVSDVCDDMNINDIITKHGFF
jgi:CMP-N-acetylneuraminic acid synthetase/regulator of RNase E activity RraA